MQALSTEGEADTPYMENITSSTTPLTILYHIHAQVVVSCICHTIICSSCSIDIPTSSVPRTAKLGGPLD